MKTEYGDFVALHNRVKNAERDLVSSRAYAMQFIFIYSYI